MLYLLSIIVLLNSCNSLENEDIKHVDPEKKLSEQILEIMEFYKQPEPVGVPGIKIPDPYPVPDMKKSFALANMNFKNMQMTGLNNIKILQVKAEIAAMEVVASMKINKLRTYGNYSMSTWISSSRGPFVVNLTDVYITARGNLDITREGKLQVQQVSMDITFKDISLNFENLGFMGSVFQGIANTVGTFLFDSIKPYVLKEAYTKSRTEINKNLDKIAGDIEFPNSISPLDMVLSDVRNLIRDKGYDPYRIKDYNNTNGMFTINLAHTWVTGLSSFHRVGNISLSIENNTLICDFEIGTQKLVGNTQWDINGVAGLISRAGTASFSVEYISARIILAQSLDTRKKPEFRDIQSNIGNIQVRCDGAGTLDYVIEFVVNILPNLLRYQIAEAVKFPIKEKVQKELNTMDVEAIIKARLPQMDNLNIADFKLSSLKIEKPSHAVKIEESDEFFNF